MAATIGIAHSNSIDQATLSGGSWTRALTYLQGSTGRDYAEYAESTTSTAEIIIDHGTAKKMQVFCLVAHTANVGTETITVTAGTTSGGTDVYNGAPLACWAFAPLDDDFDGSYFHLWVVLPAEITARYAKIVVAGSAAMRFGRLAVMRLFLPTYNPVYGRIADDWMDSRSIVDRMAGGATKVWRRGRPQRSAPFEYSVLPPAEASLWSEIVRTHDITGEVGWIRSTQDRSEQQQRGFLGLLRKLSGLENPFYGHQSSAIAIDEIGGAP